MDNVEQISPVGESWSEYRKAHYTVEEIVENDLMVQLVGEIVKTRKENHISQKELENKSPGRYLRFTASAGIFRTRFPVLNNTPARLSPHSSETTATISPRRRFPCR